jgi:glycosyltransferase involved in cell wall biosynthesis
MAEVHRMARAPEVIRNVPFYEEHSFRPTGDQVGVLYHGIVVPGRGLEGCVQSVAGWPARFSLTIRGPAEASYAAELRALAAREGVEDRVHFAPAVPMVDLVREASAFDLGIFVLPLNKLHNVHVLPNKLFEYLMAGLGLIVSAAPEMAEIVEEYDAGVLIRDLDTGAIARAVASLDTAAIDRYKRNALKASRQLNWEAESARLVEAYAAAIGWEEHPAVAEQAGCGTASGQWAGRLADRVESDIA